MGKGCLGCFMVFVILWALGATYFAVKDEKQEDPLKDYPDQTFKLPPPDSTREIEFFDFSTMEYKYKESKKLEYSRQRRRLLKDNYEDQIIIDGKRYRLDHRNDGTHLIPIR